MIEAVAAEIASGVVAHAGARIASQLRGNLRRRRNRQTDEEAVAGLLCTPRVAKSLRFHAIDYPAGMDVDKFKKFMSDPATDGVIFEVLVATLASAPTTSRQAILERWCVEARRLLPWLDDTKRDQFIADVFAVVVEECQIIAGTLEADYPAIAEKIRSQSHFQRLAAVLEAIERRLVQEHSWDTWDPVREESFLANYRSQAAKAHGFITPPDFDRRKRVPLNDIYVSPTIKGTSVDEQDQVTVAELISRIDRTVLLGDPGGGKSTAASVTMHTKALDPNGLVPFMVILREFASGEEIDESIVEHIEKRLRVVYQCPAPEGVVERLLESGRCLVIFDGLDELLDTTKRREVTDLVDLFCSRFPLAPVLVTSRRVGYDQAPMDPKQFASYEIFGFEDAQVKEYVTKWFSQDDSLTLEEATAWASSFVEESTSVPDLRSNPLLLALMCIIYRGEHSIPKNRPAIYERCAMMLFEKWDSSRKIHVELRVGMLVDPAMKFLAYWMLTQQGGTEGVPEDTLIRQTSEYLQNNEFEDSLEADAAAKEFVEFCRGRAWVFSDAGSTADGEPLYKFTHRTFMEYFAAYHLTRIHDTPEKLARSLVPRVANAEWDMVAQLALQIVEKHTHAGAERFYSNLLKERVRRSYEKRANLLSFLSRCLPFVTLTPLTLRLLIRQVVEHAVRIDASSTRMRRSSIIQAYGSLLAAAVGPRESSIRAEIRGQLVLWGQSDNHTVASQALYTAALGWVGLYVGPTPASIMLDMDEQIRVAGTTFDSVYPSVRPAAKLDLGIQAYAWARGFHQLSEILEDHSRPRSPLWTPIVLRPYGYHMNSAGIALAIWFAVERTTWLPLQDPKNLLAQVGRVAQEPKGPERLLRLARPSSMMSSLRHAEVNPQVFSFDGFSEDAALGGVWLLWWAFTQSPQRMIEELLESSPESFGRARIVAEYFLLREPTVVDSDIPESVNGHLERWADVRRRTLASRKKRSVPLQPGSADLDENALPA